MYDVIGVGALNVDYILTRQKLLALDPGTVADIGAHFAPGKERPVGEGEIIKVLLSAGESAFEVFLGGSAFNTIHTLAALDSGLRWGFVGMAGRPHSTRADFQAWFGTHGVDARYVGFDKRRLAGTCISLLQDGERSLLTYPGANLGMAGHLRRRFSKVSDMLSQARVVHVTSFFDDETPAVLARVLQDAKRKNDHLCLSFDPGNKWLEDNTEPVRAILDIADYLFVSESELAVLGGRETEETLERLATRVLARYGATSPVIVVKQPTGATVFQRVRGRAVCQRYSATRLAADEIEDATGAGDVFAGGFLYASLLPGMGTRHAVDLGLRLARSKLKEGGSSGYDAFSSIADAYFADTFAV